MDNGITASFDIGIASNGWAVFNNNTNQFDELGVRIYDQATPANKARAARSHRRNLRRKKWRKDQLKKAFVEFGLLTEDEINQHDYLSYTANTESFTRPNYDTVYHLRKAGLSGVQLNNRELLLALYSICRSRGHFLMEDIDFSKDNITFSEFKDKFYQDVDEYVSFKENKTTFEKEVLEKTFYGNMSADEIKSIFFEDYCEDDDSAKALVQIINLLNKKKAKLVEVDEGLFSKDSKPKDMAIMDLQKLDEDKTNDFFNNMIDLYNFKEVYKIRKDNEYICELCVKKLDEMKSIYKMEKEDPERYEAKRKEIQSKMNKPKTTHLLKVVRNIENGLPNGWYVKEVVDILRCQQKYNDKITDHFIEVCSSIISARIPYYIGPLGDNAKNGWAIKTGNFKYSYNYCKNNAVDELESIKKWKKAMISHCTYFPEEEAMPKGSFLYETFAIINEMNVLKAVTESEDDYYLTMKDKVRIIDELFLEKNEVKFEDVKQLLGLEYFGTKSNTHGGFKNKYTLYKSIVKILPKYKLNSITELFETDNPKIEMLEKIALDINLFDEESSKRENFQREPYCFDEETCKKLSKLKTKKFYSLSKKLIFNQPMNENKETMIEILFKDNHNYSNEQESIIYNAVDENGEKIDLRSNKYLNKIEKGKPLSIDLLIDNGKNTLPISREVVRALNECFKLYEKIIEVYGVPKRVVIETARDMKDSSRKGEVPQKHFEKLEDSFKYLKAQLNESRNNLKILSKGTLSNWDEIKEYITKNKRKIELYINQNGMDMISGEKIDINSLYNYEIDHILPRGFGDNSIDNLMLIHKNYNAIKNNRVPLEFSESGDAITGEGKPITSSSFISRCEEMLKIKLISEKKFKQLTLEKSEVSGFINRNLVDTRYIISEFMSILNAYNKVNGYETKIVALKAGFTKVYRDALDIQKVRDLGVQHHAYDAATLIIADKVLSEYYPNYDSRGDYKKYQYFISKISKTHENNKNGLNEKRMLNNFIQMMYNQAFGNNYKDPQSAITKMKETKPLYSLKAEKNYSGIFFDATIKKQKDGGKNSVLDLLGINSKERIYNSVKCVATDFYKYTDKNGVRKHLAVQIPYVIVGQNGEINKDLYLRLIREWYKVPDVLDDEGNLKVKECFRFRAFSKDLVYDTVNNCIQSFVPGTISGKILEFHHIYCFNHNDIYKKGKEIRNKINKKFRIYDEKGKPINDFENISKLEVVQFCCSQNIITFPSDEFIKSVIVNARGIKGLYNFSLFLAFVDASAMWRDQSSIYNGRFRPSVTAKVENNLSKANKKILNDSEYVKIKCSVLGIRWDNARVDEDKIHKINISGPRKLPQLFSKIKKEDFSWNISKKMIE